MIIALILAQFSDRILGLFNSAYPALAGSAVRLFGLGLLGGVMKQHFILLMRMRRKMMIGALWLGAGACLELSLAAAGGAAGGVVWLTIGWLVAVTAEVGFLLLVVLRFSRSAPHLRATGPISEGKSLLRGMADKLIVSDGSSGSSGRIMSARTLAAPVSNGLPTTGTGQ